VELLIILAIILLFFGAKRVPELGRSLGKGMRELRKGAASEDDRKDQMTRLLNKDREEEELSLNRTAARGELSHTKEEARTTHTSTEQDL